MNSLQTAILMLRLSQLMSTEDMRELHDKVIQACEENRSSHAYDLIELALCKEDLL
tara:strand:- start:594 stop:761 length:168 start_codon:yes stop_codon:yes gene_type:complete